MPCQLSDHGVTSLAGSLGCRSLWLLTTLILSTVGLLACAPGEEGGGTGTPQAAEAPTSQLASATDPHSFARPEEASVRHLNLELEVDFAQQVLEGTAILDLELASDAQELHLDTVDLEIHSVTFADGREASFRLGEPQEDLGRALIIDLRPQTDDQEEPSAGADRAADQVTVRYTTSPEAAAVQWLEPGQTAGGEHPFLYTQSQAILARTWVPCQDTPAVRMTYEATVKVPPQLMAVMSAENPTELRADGVYSFRMPQAIPSYLLALAVGDLEFRSLGPTSGVYAEPSVVAEAAWEFADTESMIETTSELYGPYRWGRFDVLVLPPSFPYGGMENPRLTFATPTILAGDRSLVALIAHELAHSWSGNLVTNATWNDFWLNEGFTVYLERRIMEALRGRPYSEMLASLGRNDLQVDIDRLDSRDTHLHLDLAGRDPDDGMTDVAYEKGYLLLRTLEERVGRDNFDSFLRAYFDRYAFQSLTTSQFQEDLQRELLDKYPEAMSGLDLNAWIYGPGVPDTEPRIQSDAFDTVDAQLAMWVGGAPASKLSVDGWSTHEWLHFLRGLPSDLSTERMADLDSAFTLTNSGNSEILNAWFLASIDNGYEAARPAMESFLSGMGRRKFLRPIYERLAQDEEGLAWARAVYEKARGGYHAVSRRTLDEVLGL